MPPNEDAPSPVWYRSEGGNLESGKIRSHVYLPKRKLSSTARSTASFRLSSRASSSSSAAWYAAKDGVHRARVRMARRLAW